MAVARNLQVEPYYLKVRLRVRKHLGLQEVRVPVLPIHEILHAVCASGQANISLFGGYGQEEVQLKNIPFQT